MDHRPRAFRGTTVDVHPDRTSREIRAARVSRRPPRFAATVMALGIIFAVAYIFFLRTPPPVPTPELRAITGSYRLERSLAADQPGATPRPTASGSFAASASGDAAGTMQPSPSPTRRDDPRPLRASYDAKLRAALTTATFLGRDITTRTVDAWPPAWQVATPSPLDYQGLAAIVRPLSLRGLMPMARSLSSTAERTMAARPW